MAKVIFTYRDPHDNVLSAIDHGKEVRSNLRNDSTFQNLNDLKSGIFQLKPILEDNMKWFQTSNVFSIR